MIELVAKLDGVSKEINVIDDKLIIIDGRKFEYSLSELGNNKYLLRVENKIYEVSLLSSKNGLFEIFINNKLIQVNVLSTLQEKALTLLKQSHSSTNHQTDVRSPMPGLVIKLNKNVGDEVIEDETVLVLEAMKMENEIKAPVSGKITEIYVSHGSAIEKNILLFTIK